MTGALAGLAGLAEAQIPVALLVYLRMLGAALVMPALGERSLPVRIRAGVALALAAVLYPVVAPGTATPEAADLPGLCVVEAATGLALGMLLRFTVTALQICGSIIAQVTSLAQLMGFTSVEPLPVIGHILAFAGLALLVMADMHVAVVRALVRTYDLVPIGAALSPGDLTELAVSRVAQMFALSFALAAPFILMALLYNLALGAINRAMPQLMVALVGAPAILFATIALLAVAAPMLLGLWLDSAMAILADPLGAR